jgi:hypothetical protein
MRGTDSGKPQSASATPTARECATALPLHLLPCPPRETAAAHQSCSSNVNLGGNDLGTGLHLLLTARAAHDKLTDAEDIVADPIAGCRAATALRGVGRGVRGGDGVLCASEPRGRMCRCVVPWKWGRERAWRGRRWPRSLIRGAKGGHTVADVASAREAASGETWVGTSGWVLATRRVWLDAQPIIIATRL